MRLQGKSALVTGAGKGIGLAIAKLFAQEGAKVAINYHSSSQAALTLIREVKKQGSQALAIKADVSRIDEVKKMVQLTVEKFDTIDILVNNAGIMMPAAFLDCTEEIWDMTLAINLKGAYLCSREVAPIMLRQGKGRIVNISSLAGLAERTSLRNTAYTVSKAGIIGLTRSLTVNLGPTINVNAICPGFIDTDMSASLSPDRRMKAIEDSPLKRTGTPEEIAQTALFLVCDDSNFITGEIFTVSGGIGMR